MLMFHMVYHGFIDNQQSKHRRMTHSDMKIETSEALFTYKFNL